MTSHAGQARCPGCAEVHYVDETAPLFGGAQLKVGESARTIVDPAIFTAAVWEDRLWRLRPPHAGTRLDILCWLEDVFACSCDRVLAPVLRFVIEPAQVTLDELALLDVERADLASEIDFVGEWGLGSEHAEEVAAKPIEARVAWLRERVKAWTEPRPAREGWTTLVGPTQCEACGDVRERKLTTLFTQPNVEPPAMASLFGPGFEGRTLYLGDRVRVGAEWQPTEYFYKVLRRVAATCTVLTKQQPFGCRCGAGRAAMVIKLARRGEELELVELGLRVVRSEADLADVDVVEGSHPSELARILDAYR